MVIRKNLLLALLLYPLFSYSVTFESDYDGDGINDQISEENDMDKIDLTMKLSSVNYSTFKFKIDKSDDEIAPSSHKSFNSGEIEIDSTYPSQGGAVYSELYRWDISKKKWHLIKLIEGVKENDLDGRYTPNLNIKRIRCCYYLGDNKSTYHEISKDDLNEQIMQELKSLKLLINQKDNNQIMRKMNIYLATEYAEYIDNENVGMLNIIANTISNTDWQSSVIILQKITEKYPQKLDSLLDLANTYWNSNNPIIQKEAIALYKKYQQNSLLKESKTFPNYITERIESNQ